MGRGGVGWGDAGGNARLLAHHHRLFPAQIEDDEDVLWELEHRESKAEIMERGLRFTQVLRLRRPGLIGIPG